MDLGTKEKKDQFHNHHCFFNMKQNIIFFGSGSYTIPVVKKLLDHNLKAVATSDKSGPLVAFCKQNNIEIISDLNNYNFENTTLGVLASYGKIIPDNIIKRFKNGIINIHPSNLPKYKGPSPIQYTILNGEKTTGVTVIKLDDQIDHGPILDQKNYDLKGSETTKDLLDELFSIGAEMVEKIVVKLENGESLSETPQDHSKESWSQKIEKKDGEINPDNLPSNLGNMIRAFYPWPGVWFRTNLKGQEKMVKLFPDEKIQVEGKNVMSYKDFINGYGNEGKLLLQKLELN